MLSWLEQPALLAALAVALTAAATDLRSRTVPNALVLAGLVSGVALHALGAGSRGALLALAGAAAGFALFLPFYLLGGMGGGDVKLMAALGACLGPTSIVRVAVAASLLGAVLALAFAARAGLLRRTLSRTGRLLAAWATRGPRPLPEISLEAPGALAIPYALPIAAGALLATLVTP
ncbi:MAG TPA: A24 family peptidase [Candidatus Polarisedimenticolia bacterium]|nr:A24 family peptidase [Candidatus Polarisedimenticolia bacterium]